MASQWPAAVDPLKCLNRSCILSEIIIGYYYSFRKGSEEGWLDHWKVIVAEEKEGGERGREPSIRNSTDGKK